MITLLFILIGVAVLVALYYAGYIVEWFAGKATQYLLKLAIYWNTKWLAKRDADVAKEKQEWAKNYRKHEEPPK